MSNIKNFEVEQGTSFTITFALTDTELVAFDLTGYTAQLQIRRSYGNTSTLVDATTENGKLNISAGSVLFYVVPADTENIKFNDVEDESLECVYDLKIFSPIGKEYKPAKGSFTIMRTVTR